jgi:UDP-N-acetylmuramate-alanine ligase
MNQYVVTKQIGRSIVDYLHDMGIQTAAIYGMAHMGQRVIDDLKGSDIKVPYGIDRRADRLTYEIPIYHPEDELPEVDAIIVTAFDFDEIEAMLSEKTESKIIDFNDMIYQI